MLPMHRLLLRDCMLVVLYDERFSESFISMIALKKQLYIEGKGIRQVCLAGFVHTSYERLQEQLMQLKECLRKQLCSALLLSVMQPLPIMVYRKRYSVTGSFIFQCS